jgi:MerR family Zn(II)-responsive transcriptional regulator of zntA
MKVIELARQVGVPAHVVRYYTRIDLLKPARDYTNGYKLFTSDDVCRLTFIRNAQALGFTLAEIAEIFREAEKGDSPCPMVREIIAERIKENRHRVEELLDLQSRMEQAVIQWGKMPDGIPNGHSVCHLIEAASCNR